MKVLSFFSTESTCYTESKVISITRCAATMPDTICDHCRHSSSYCLRDAVVPQGIFLFSTNFELHTTFRSWITWQTDGRTDRRAATWTGDSYGGPNV